MDAPTATVIAALIAGIVAVVANVTVFLNMRRQIITTQLEAQRNREHQRLLLAQQRSLDAIQVVWRTVYSIQNTGKMEKSNETDLISSMIWLPDNLRDKIGALVGAYSGEDLALRRSTLISTQSQLLLLSKIVLSEENPDVIRIPKS